TGRTVTIFAVAKAADTPTLLVINAQVDMFSASVSTPTAFAGFFIAKGKGVSAPTSHGVHIDGDAVLTGGAGTRTLHLVGDGTGAIAGAGATAMSGAAPADVPAYIGIGVGMA